MIVQQILESLLKSDLPIYLAGGGDLTTIYLVSLLQKTLWKSSIHQSREALLHFYME